MEPTGEQTQILDTVRTSDSNLLIRALAGTGKTSTLELIEAEQSGPILCLAFNKKIAEEMAKRFKTTTTVRTLNSLGHRIWAKANASGLTLDPKKTQTFVKEAIKALNKNVQAEGWEEYWNVVNGVAMAKALGYVPDSCFPNAKRLIDDLHFWNSLEEYPSPLCVNLIDQVLCASIKSAYKGLIDYNDQIYMPALFGGTFPRFPLVMVDEAQDLSPTNHAMLDKLGRGRIIAVGDPWQSIYGFRGAKQNGMADLERRFEMSQADLSVSFRCPQRIVENARWRVPHFKWNKEGGHVKHLRELVSSHLSDNAAIICRNNSPLFRIAFSLLASGRSVSVAGSDVGPKLIGILRRLGDEGMARSAVLAAIAEWEDAKVERGSTTARDLAECMRVFANHGVSLGQAIAYAEHLFTQKGSIRLLTGHKAKGLEFPTVYHLDPWLLGDDEQDLNLRYVIQTRAKAEYFEIDSRNIKW